MTTHAGHAPHPARPSVRGHVPFDLFHADDDIDADYPTDSDIADAIAAVEPYLPGDDGIGHNDET